jgi:hypothetical protein
MNAELLVDERVKVGETAFAAIRLWRVPTPVQGSAHPYKYRVAFIVEGKCVLRYDNEAGKGDHKHLGESQTGYLFTSPGQLLADFWKDIETWQSLNRDR